jgi:hypothetical protein
MNDKAEIYCPQCQWRAGPQDKWQCVPLCGTVWNTFWTRDVCPGCAVKWPLTQCLACGKFSPHEAWYHAPNESESEDEAATQPEEAAA